MRRPKAGNNKGICRANRYVKWGAIIALLILANIINYLYWNWGLVTVKVTDAPLTGKVIKSIEWQGWVTIYTNLPGDAKVTMWVDHVPVAEAMKTLCGNITMPPRDLPPGVSPGPRTPPAPGVKDASGPLDGVYWNLGFFVAPSAAEVKEEIRAFQESTWNNTTKIYNFPTPLQLVITQDDVLAADPCAQSWPGIKPSALPAPAPPAPPTPPPAAAPATDGQAAAPVAPPAPPPVPTVQTYLRAFAREADIWIMSPTAWAPPVSDPP